VNAGHLKLVTKTTAFITVSVN